LINGLNFSNSNDARTFFILLATTMSTPQLSKKRKIPTVEMSDEDVLMETEDQNPVTNTALAPSPLSQVIYDFKIANNKYNNNNIRNSIGTISRQNPLEESLKSKFNNLLNTELKETVARYSELINQRKLEREAIKFITAAAQQFPLESETVENFVPEISNANFWLVIELNDIGMQKWNDVPDEVMEFFSQFNGCDVAALTLEGSTLPLLHLTVRKINSRQLSHTKNRILLLDPLSKTKKTKSSLEHLIEFLQQLSTEIFQKMSQKKKLNWLSLKKQRPSFTN
jgi:hypothetical protein